MGQLLGKRSADPVDECGQVRCAACAWNLHDGIGGGSLAGSPLAQSSLGFGFADTGGASFGGAASPSKLKFTGGFVGSGTVTENGRTVEYSTLRGHKQRVVRTLTAMQQTQTTLQASYTALSRLGQLTLSAFLK